MKAWGKMLDPSGSSGVSSLLSSDKSMSYWHLQIRFLGDPSLSFTKALDLSFDGASIFGGDRSKRYALVIENGAVKEAHVEPDNTGLNGLHPFNHAISTTCWWHSVSAADKVL
jgi:2-Cys peroxiredoxin 5